MLILLLISVNAYIDDHIQTQFYEEQLSEKLNFYCESGRMVNGNDYYTYQLFLKQNYTKLSQFKQDDFLFIILTQNGCSAIHDAFDEYGPFEFGGEKLRLDPNSLNSFANLLYVDSPFGTGYSNGSGNYNDTPQLILTFLEEFTQLKGLNKGRLYLLGNELAAQLMPKILKLSLKSDFNISGMIADDGWISPIHQIAYYGSLLYQIGLIDEQRRDEINYNVTSMQIKILNQNTTADDVELLINMTQSIKNQLENEQMEEQEETKIINNFLFNNSKQFYGLNVSFQEYCNETTQKYYQQFIFNSSISDIETLLNFKKSVVLVSQQLELRVTSPGIATLINQLKWENTENWMFSVKEFIVDSVYDDQKNTTKNVTLGYIKKYKNLKYLVTYDEQFRLFQFI